MQENIEAFLKLVKHPIKFRLFLLSKLPAALYSGVRVVSADAEKCSVSIPYKWFTKNPFRSTYFACLSMAAEMSTGLLAMMYLHKRQTSVAILVVEVNSVYIKKATGLTTFICNDGKQFSDAIDKSIATGQSETVAAKSTGRNAAGEIVAEFSVTWSFKARVAK